MATRVLITGATSGIGYELAKVFAREKHELILVGRNPEKLAKVVGEISATKTVCHSILADLAQPGAADHIVTELKKQNLTVDILVNNAGIGTYGLLWELDPAKERALIATNVSAVMELTQALLPSMIERKQGYVLNIASVAGFAAAPFATNYYASKAFIISFSEGLRSSLKGTGVGVTVVCPGSTSHTGFNDDISPQEKPNRFELPHLTAAQVAERAYKAMQQGRALVVTGFRNAFLVALMVHTPRRLVTEAIARGQRYVNAHNKKEPTS